MTNERLSGGEGGMVALVCQMSLGGGWRRGGRQGGLKQSDMANICHIVRKQESDTENNKNRRAGVNKWRQQ